MKTFIEVSVTVVFFGGCGYIILKGMVKVYFGLELP